MKTHQFGQGGFKATVSAHGAELASLCLDGEREVIWGAEPIWPRHSPVLFPFVGRLAGDTARIGGHDYGMTQHGFARDRLFDWVERRENGCRLVLRDDAVSRQRYPFAFELVMDYTLGADGLTVDYTVHNPDAERVLPASLGVHPAFVWPFDPDIAKTDYQIVFAQDEPAPIRRVKDGLLMAEHFPSPVAGNILPLSEALFEQDAVIFDRIGSHSLVFQAKGGKGLEIAWHGFKQLGIWMKPGADFLCIEPWHGFASPVDFHGPFEEKPGILHLQPGESFHAGWSVRSC